MDDIKKNNISNNFKHKTNSDGCKGDYMTHHVPNIRHLTRVIVYLKEINIKCTKSEICKQCTMENTQIKGALLWLVNNKIVIKDHKRAAQNNGTYYSLNPDWLKLKYGENYFL